MSEETSNIAQSAQETIFSEKQQRALYYLEHPSFKDVTEVFFGGSAGGGKAEYIENQILTPFGSKRMGDIKPNDLVIGSNGYPIKVIAVHPQGVKQMYRVTFMDNTFVLCCKDHLWLAWNASRKSKSEKRRSGKGTLYDTVSLMKKVNEGHNNMIIPLCEPVHFTPTPSSIRLSLKFHPYILGALIGDGSLSGNGATITNGEVDVTNRISELLPDSVIMTDHKDNIVFGFKSSDRNVPNELTKWLKDLGLLGHVANSKFIPKALLHASINDRIELAGGLMDTDGHVSEDGGHLEYSTVSDQLSKDVAYLLRGLGCRVRIRFIPTNHYVLDGIKHDAQPYYRLSIRSNNDKDLFFLPRKKNRCKPYNGGFSELGKRIVSITLDEHKECQCITVNAPDRLYLTENFTVTHNSMLGCSWQISRRLGYPGTRGLIGRAKLKTLRATTLKTFYDVWDKYYKTNDAGVTMKVNHDDWIIYFSNGSEIILKDLFLYPSDPNFDSLGSLEITDAFYDELPEITEKAYTICNSRIRYKVIDGVPKSYAAGNPSPGWVKNRFVVDSNNVPIKLEPYQRFVPAKVDDNPDKAFVEIYKAQLEKLPYFDRQRLLHGDWTLIDNDNPFFFEFNYNTNTVPDIPHNPNVDLILSFDFNSNPCTAILGYVEYGKGIYFMREWSEPGGTRGILKKMDWLKDLTQVIQIVGDNSGHSTQSSAVYTDYEIIEDFFSRQVELRTKKANGSHLRSKAICNHALFNVPMFFSRKGCPELINQMIGARQDNKGGLSKKPVDNHLADTFRYFLNLVFVDVKEINHFADMVSIESRVSK